jgi:hypothetical protein
LNALKLVTTFFALVFVNWHWLGLCGSDIPFDFAQGKVVRQATSQLFRF